MNIKALKQLIRVIQRQIEEELIQKSLLEKQVEDITEAIKIIKQLLLAESQALTEQPLSYYDYYAFYSHHKSKQDELETEVNLIKLSIEKKLHNLHNLFINKKQYESLVAKSIKAQQEIMNKIENAALDEIGIQNFRNSYEEAH